MPRKMQILGKFPSSGGTDEQIASAIAKYFVENPIETNYLPVRVTTITLLADKWTGNESPYSQVVSVPSITANSQVDLKFTYEQWEMLHDKEISFTSENVDGVVTIYAIGNKPTYDYTLQVTITEVVEV